MYTQCPECSAAFRVTANDLKQAAGKVRCGGCGRAFDALEFLSEQLPAGESSGGAGPKLPELKPDVPGKRRPKTVSPEDSIALLKTLDQLAGSDIRLEDTGIEWRVLDDQALAALETDEEPHDGEAAHASEQRYDDDTPLDEEPPEPDPEAAAAQPADESPAAANELDVDFDDDETGEWEEILDEFDDSDDGEDHAIDEQGDVDPLTGTSVQQSAEDDAAAGDDEAEEDAETAQDDAPEQAQAEDDVTEPGDDDEADDETAQDDTPDEAAAGESGDADRATAGDDADETGDDASVDEHSPEVREEDVAVESIILEGDTVRSALDTDDEEALVELSTFWVLPEEDEPAERPAATRFGMVLAAILLLIALGLQAVHQNRAELATIPALRNVIAPAYRAAGMPLVPTWDVRGWRFEATRGDSDADADQLIVYSRLGNTSDEPLPYPLIGVSLTDRFEETVGGVLMEPARYLGETRNPREPVAPGATFDAVITLQSPDPAATGYRLRACYRTAPGKLRCAVGDFRQ